MDADAEVKWRHVGSCEYLLTDRQILRLTTHSSKVNRFETIRVLLSHNDGGIVIRFMDYSAIMLRMQNWLLHQLVLEHMWRVYHDLPLFPPSRQQAVVGQSQTPAATPTVTPTGPPG